MKLVRQQHDWDCGVACVSMIVGQPYEVVLPICLAAKNGERVKGMITRHVVTAVRALGGLIADPPLRPLRGESWDGLPPSLVKVKHPGSTTSGWHWVIWDSARQKVLDPALLGDIKPAKYRMVPRSFLTIAVP